MAGRWKRSGKHEELEVRCCFAVLGGCCGGLLTWVDAAVEERELVENFWVGRIGKVGFGGF